LLAGLTCLALLLVGFSASSASAATTRNYETSFGSFPGSANPSGITVDQSNGDIYVVSTGPNVVSRFDAAGNPKNFTAGPNAGTNTLTGFSFLSGIGDVAVDNSGGPLNGDIYVANSQTNAVSVFSGTGVALGSFTAPDSPAGTHTMCGIGIDQTNGSVYATDSGGERIWRFAPNSPSGPIELGDYTVTGVEGNGRFCGVAAHAGRVYAKVEAGLLQFSASSFGPATPGEFGLNLPAATRTNIDEGPVTAVEVDPKNGDVYADEGSRVTVFDSSAKFLYRFGHAAEMGNESAGIAVKRAPAAAATKAYVSDRQPGGHQVDVYGALTQAPTITHPEFGPIGRDGTPATPFSGDILRLALDNTTRRLYVTAPDTPGIFGFDVATPPSFAPVAGFSPLTTPPFSEALGFAVDNTGLSSAGRLYLDSIQTNLVYGFTPAGTQLGSPFPLDPAVSPGSPNGSPTSLCGAAVDSAGNVWVANSATSRILEYSSAGASMPGVVNTSSQGKPCALAFDSNDDLYASTENGVWKYTAASGYATATRFTTLKAVAIAVDPVTHRLFAAFDRWVDEYDSSGGLIDEFAFDFSAPRYQGIAVDPNNRFVYVAAANSRVVRVFGPGVILPEIQIGDATALANTSATLAGSVGGQGLALSDCHFEYVTKAAFRVSGFGDLGSGGSVDCSPSAGTMPADLNQHAVSGAVTGLERGTAYVFRLAATNSEGSAASGPREFDTSGPPDVETVGSPLRTALGANLEGRLNPRGAATEYHFEYGTAGPCDSNPCESTSPQAAGSGSLIEFVSQPVVGLVPGMTYHYRLVADNGNPDGPAFGGDMTVTTRDSDAPLTHGHFPGPTGSDRAWEQVNLANTGGNPVLGGMSFSDSGERAIYQIPGGTPITDSGSAYNQFFAERSPGGWLSKQILPPRADVVGPNWVAPFGTPELSKLFTFNANITSGQLSYWRLQPAGAPARLLESSAAQSDFFVASEDGSRDLIVSRESIDSAHPTAPGVKNLYDISSGAPQLVSLLPDNSAPTCGIGGSPAAFGLPINSSRETEHRISADGRFLLFPSSGASCGGPVHLYVRDMVAGSTVDVAPAPISGNDCGAAFVKSTPGAVFFWTQSRLSAADSVPLNGCTGTSGGDVYRYDLSGGAVPCDTCVIPGLAADVFINTGASKGPAQEIAVAEDGSRVYFQSSSQLLPGAAAPGVYRVDVAGGDFAYVAPAADTKAGDNAFFGNAISSDGSVLIFRSDNAALNQLNGAQNGGRFQYYRYDDDDRSLVCASCPQDGSAAPAPAVNQLASPSSDEVGPNANPLDDDGETFVFSTPTTLVGADQNGAQLGQDPSIGIDLYEWRDGRLLLVSDGLTRWPNSAVAPTPNGVSPSGRDVFFTASAQYTPDALDAYNRLYDARIGGGIDFPAPPKPCPLEVCQGTPKGAPATAEFGSQGFAGPGNVKAEAKKKKKRHKKHRKHRGRHGTRHASHGKGGTGR
jgi:sugar lactone lactonase YvrE